MKKTLLLLLSLLTGAALWAQAPQGFSYQAVVRDANGQVVANQAVGVRLSLMQMGDADMTVRYSEVHFATTNAAGLMTIVVGDGVQQSEGTMADIDWANGPWYLRSEVDPAGGTAYALTTTQQLLSAPYALWAANGLSIEEREFLTTFVDNFDETWVLLLQRQLEGKADSERVDALESRVDSLASLPVETCCDAVGLLAARVDSLASLPAETCCDALGQLASRLDSLEAVLAGMKEWMAAYMDSALATYMDSTVVPYMDSVVASLPTRGNPSDSTGTNPGGNPNPPTPPTPSTTPPDGSTLACPAAPSGPATTSAPTRP